MTIDSFTASVALSLIESNPSSSTIEALSGILKDKGDNEPVPDDVVAFIESNIGNPVMAMQALRYEKERQNETVGPKEALEHIDSFMNMLKGEQK